MFSKVEFKVGSSLNFPTMGKWYISVWYNRTHFNGIDFIFFELLKILLKAPRRIRHTPRPIRTKQEIQNKRVIRDLNNNPVQRKSKAKTQQHKYPNLCLDKKQQIKDSNTIQPGQQHYTPQNRRKKKQAFQRSMQTPGSQIHSYKRYEFAATLFKNQCQEMRWIHSTVTSTSPTTLLKIRSLQTFPFVVIICYNRSLFHNKQYLRNKHNQQNPTSNKHQPRSTTK
jgi:hypothetical protein